MCLLLTSELSNKSTGPGREKNGGKDMIYTTYARGLASS